MRFQLAIIGFSIYVSFQSFYEYSAEVRSILLLKQIFQRKFYMVTSYIMSGTILSIVTPFRVIDNRCANSLNGFA